jgi:NAD+ kinase
MSARGVERVALVAHPDRAAARDLARRAAALLQERGVEVRVPAADAEAVGLGALARLPAELVDRLDVAISLGGDGTMLRAVDQVFESGAAIMGVNVGQLGYLAEVEPSELLDAVERLVAGDYAVQERMMLSVSVERDGSAPTAERWWALNEAVLEKERAGHLARLDVVINGQDFTTYAADGVIVATPTGSTAYSFSARGPIVSPRHRCLLLTPVSPHMLFDRALVLDASEELYLRVSGPRPVLLTLDGRELDTLEPGDGVRCTGAPAPARIVTLQPRDFHQILKAKFGLPDR